MSFTRQTEDLSPKEGPLLWAIFLEIISLRRSDLDRSGSIETVGGSPQEFATALKADIARRGKVITDAGIRGKN